MVYQYFSVVPFPFEKIEIEKDLEKFTIKVVDFFLNKFTRVEIIVLLNGVFYETFSESGTNIIKYDISSIQLKTNITFRVKKKSFQARGCNEIGCSFQYTENSTTIDKRSRKTPKNRNFKSSECSSHNCK